VEHLSKSHYLLGRELNGGGRGQRDSPGEGLENNNKREGREKIEKTLGVQGIKKGRDIRGMIGKKV